MLTNSPSSRVPLQGVVWWWKGQYAMEELSARIVEDYIFSVVLRLYRKAFGFQPTILYAGLRTEEYKATVSYAKDKRRTTVTAFFKELRVTLDVSHSKLVRGRETRHDYKTGKEFTREIESWQCLKYWALDINVADPSSKHRIIQFLAETFRAIKRGRL
jgi:hypothetical protein